MSDISEVTVEKVCKISDVPSIAILMCTKDGAQFLGEQLKSIADQTHTNWRLIVSDDGSTDETIDILMRFGDKHPHKVIVKDGPKKGTCANFLSLATDSAIEADFFAFSDQDDIWYPNKLQRALDWLTTVPGAVPAMYCGRTELIKAGGRSFGFSQRFTRPPAFANALVQNLGGGNTMVFNRPAKKLVEQASALGVVLHDWWAYQLISAAGGAIRYDRQSTLKYRQHPNSLIGSNLSWRAVYVRFFMVLKGRFREWNAMNIAALEQLPDHLIKAENRAVLVAFAKARSGSLPMLLKFLRQSGVYRQTFFGNIGLFVATVFKRI